MQNSSCTNGTHDSTAARPSEFGYRDFAGLSGLLNRIAVPTGALQLLDAQGRNIPNTPRKMGRHADCEALDQISRRAGEEREGLL